MEKRFVIGQVFNVHSWTDYDTVYRFEIIDRTDSTVVVRSHDGDIRRKIRKRDGVEWCFPFGVYSMCPSISADDGGPSHD